MEKNLKKNICMYMYTKLNLFAVNLKLSNFVNQLYFSEKKNTVGQCECK